MLVCHIPKKTKNENMKLRGFTKADKNNRLQSEKYGHYTGCPV